MHSFSLPNRVLFTVTLAAISLVSHAQAFQSVHVVNGGSGAALQTVIDAAASGDTILVHGGNFTSILIQGKALVLVSEPSLSTTVQGLTIASTSSTQVTTVAGLVVATPAYTGTGQILDCVVVDQCAGSVRLESLQATVSSPNGRPALRANQSNDVALYGCALTGSDGTLAPVLPFISPPYGEGVRCIQSRIAAYECTVRGGDGMDGFTQDACSNPFVWFNNVGSSGVSLDATSTFFASGGSIRGGMGGNGVPARCSCFTGSLIVGTNGASGGSAIDNAVGSTAFVQETALAIGNGGAGGTPAFCSATSGGGGVAGASGVPSTNPLITSSATRVQLSGPTLIRAGQTLSLTLRGTPGDIAQLGLAFEARFLPVFAANGVLLIGPSGRRVSVGVFPANGILTVNVPTAIAVPGAQSSSWHLQAFAFPTGAVQVGAGWDVTVLDPVF